MSRKIFTLFAVLVLAGAAAWAKPPVYVSFASDDYNDGPTFTGYATTITGKAKVDLMLDQQGDFVGGVVIFPSYFSFEAEMVSYNVIPQGANFLHIWDLRGKFVFEHDDAAFSNPFLLGTEFQNAVLTSLSPSATQAGETMTLQSSRSVDGVAYKDGGPLEAVLDLNYPPDYVGIGSGFAFTFTHVRVGQFGTTPPNLSSGKFKDPFMAEGSYSGEGGN